MAPTGADRARIRAAWQGRVSGCLLGKAVEMLSFEEGRAGLTAYLDEAAALPLRDYVPLREGTTAERAAYLTLLRDMDDEFVNGADAGFDLAACSDNPYNDWIGARIRADLYGWVCPGRPALAAELARRDASLSHRGDGVHGAMFVAALGAAIPATDGIDEALDAALAEIPADGNVADAVRLGRDLVGADDAVDRLYARYADLPPVHTLNNLAVVVWALCSAGADFGAAIGEAVAAGWDTDCNGATVGGLFGLAVASVPDAWTRPWQGRIGLNLAGHAELQLDDVVARTVAVAETLGGQHVLH